MAGYEDTREMIINTLMGRPVGTEIQPENHQAFALNMLDYIQSLEITGGSSLIGIATPDTTPVQPDNARVSYIGAVSPDNSVTFSNFVDENGQSITVTTTEEEAYIVILVWNTEYWTYATVPTNVIAQSENGYYYYDLRISKTYDSVADMEADVNNPIGDDGRSLKNGSIVSVHNESNTSEDAIYSWVSVEGQSPRWQLQTKLSALESRTLDGGRADSVYGGAVNIDCGNSSGSY